ncbi:TlpA family protein disulfide reductase [Thiohalocapsa marina]|uniref:TlpA family protein disulfide reductase n=1 Tax=Thiohalocapsa marina TaxID=424902 RepID=A0A5M8FNW4_9GAMM|nr:TlpA disulfide reductase family protein [Thiohalocapsa marina]KAA6184811.1 TlpA family protein disulfide reductase [Thiohalocapsa marina]
MPIQRIHRHGLRQDPRAVATAAVGLTAGLAAMFWSLLWTGPAAAAEPLQPVDGTPVAAGFELIATDGETYRLQDLRGKTLIVNFWATWCPPCLAEMPSLQRAWEQVRDEEILVLAINVGEDQAAIERFTERMPLTFPLPMDPDSGTVQAWPVRGLPTTFVVDPDGRLIYRAEGERDWDAPELLQQVRAIAADASGPQ